MAPRWAFPRRVIRWVLKNEGIWNGYRVDDFCVTVGTAWANMTASLIFAYVLARPNMMLHGLNHVRAAGFTMYFSGGPHTDLSGRQDGRSAGTVIWALISRASSAPINSSYCARSFKTCRTSSWNRRRLMEPANLGPWS